MKIKLVKVGAGLIPVIHIYEIRCLEGDDCKVSYTDGIIKCVSSANRQDLEKVFTFPNEEVLENE